MNQRILSVSELRLQLPSAHDVAPNADCDQNDYRNDYADDDARGNCRLLLYGVLDY